jgi:elongation factor 4
MNIRNFSIIAHIDHGKSTLADRLLESTHTVEDRKMRDQVLDSMELERERGITIKMTPVRMRFVSKDGGEYILNLIDTPGHIDFSYEVSRSLRAVEGALLLVDATQGVQAQTLTTLEMAQSAGIKIIPVVNKIDSPLAHPDGVKDEIVKLLGCKKEDILAVSGKTGEGVPELLEAIIERVPQPVSEYQETKQARALIFDFEYSNHQGVILYVRILDGEVKAGEDLLFLQAKHRFIIREVGTFSPEKREVKHLSKGEIGYIVTGIKEPGIARVGDTVTTFSKPLPAFPGYHEPVPLVFASLYPETQDEFDDLRSSLSKLKLSDSSLTFEEESSGALGRGFRCGFLGMLHLEIVTERLRREFDQELVITTPSITYEVTLKNGEVEMNSVTDNPVTFTGSKIVHGGNFHGDYVSFEMDKIKIAMTKLSMFSERKINFLFNDKVNKIFTPFLNLATPGLDLGLQGLQFVATSTVAENQSLSSSVYIHSIPTNNDNQDIVSMGTNSALLTDVVIRNTREVVAIELLSVVRAVYLLGILNSMSPKTREFYKRISKVVRLDQDLIVREDVEKVVKLIEIEEFSI